jgi:hypothetical protein
LPHGPDGTHAGDRPDGCPRLLQAASSEPESGDLADLKTSKALGLQVLDKLLALADEVIE